MRGQYLQDWLSDAEAPLTWRLDKAKAGSGALGDIGAHAVDLAQFITGQRVTEVSGVLRTFVEWNPVSTVTQACRELFGNTAPGVPVPDSWAMQNPVLYTLIWSAAIVAVFAPLSVRQYLSTSK